MTVKPRNNRSFLKGRERTQVGGWGVPPQRGVGAQDALARSEAPNSIEAGEGRSPSHVSSTDVQDDDAAVRVVLFLVGRWGWTAHWAFERQLQTRLLLVPALALPLLALPDLLDDEGGQHWVFLVGGLET